MKRLTIRTLLALWLTLLAAPAWSAEFVSVESRSLGDGWFEYRVRLAEDPYFETAQIGAVEIAFPGRSEYGADPADWSSDASSPDKALWNFGGQQPQSRPHERVFRVRSSHTAFRTVETALRVTYVAAPQTELLGEASPASSGVLRLRVLVPCAPAEADGSATLQSAAASLREDLRITSLQISGSALSGLSFQWPFDSTVRLESSSDLKTWTPLTTLAGDAGETSWSAEQPLQDVGTFFRLVLLANRKPDPAP